MAAKATAIFILLWALAVILGGFLLCQPFAFTWDQSIPGGHCGNQVLSYQITGALNLVTDLMVLTMPMPYLWKLEMRVSQKVPLMAVFAVGLLYVSPTLYLFHVPRINTSSVCIATIMRLVSLSLLDFTDLTDNITEAMIWGTIEPALGVTLACIPFMKPIFPFSRSMANYTQSGRTESSRGKVFSKKGFRHPYDPYPLETMVSTAGPQDGGPGMQTRPDNASDQEQLVPEGERQPGEGKGMSIVVKKDFDMR